MDIGIDLLAILFCVGFVASFIDAIAGGGGLITIPALLMTGMPPAMALGTNKLQAWRRIIRKPLFLEKKSGQFTRYLVYFDLGFLRFSPRYIINSIN